MDAFFEARLEGYDAHMLRDIVGAGEFYPFTAAQLPVWDRATVLDLGCGTGLELEYYFRKNPTARVTGIDLSAGMLNTLQAKFPEKELELICGSYFDVPLGSGVYDAAVSVESLHHFTREEKTALYRKLWSALKPAGYFVLTDYFALSGEDEAHWQQELRRLKQVQGIMDSTFYHYDTPLTLAHEQEALMEAGFQRIEVLASWDATCTLKAWK